MATSDLIQALMAARTSPADTGYGIGVNALGAVAPALITGRSSRGQDLGVGLGAFLTQAILGGLAKRQAASENSALFDAFGQYQAGDKTAADRVPGLKPVAMAIELGKKEAEQERQAKLGLMQAEFDLKKKNELPFDEQLRREGMLAETKAAAKAKFAPASAPKLSFEQEIEQIKAKKMAEAEAAAEIDAKYPKPAKAPEFGVEMMGQLAKSKAVIEEGNQVASEIEKLPSWEQYQTSRYFSGMDKNGVALTLANLADRLARARTGAAMNKEEIVLYNKLIGGDLSADPKQSAMLLRKLTKAEARMGQTTIETLQKLGDPKQALQIFSTDAAPDIKELSDAQLDALIAAKTKK